MSNYWQQRAVEQSARVHAMTEETVKKLEKEIDRATRKVNDKIRSWYTRLAQNNEISYADAKKLLKKAELEEFKWSVDEYIKIASDEALSKEWAKELENASSKAHITHLEQIKTEMRAELERMYKKVENQGSEALESVLEDGYSRTTFDYQKGLGIGWSFEAIDSNRLKTLLNSPWPSDGRNFSDRIWTNKNALLQTLEQELTQATLRGDTLQDMTDRVSKKLGVEKKKVSRLIHTETTYMNSLAAKESYKELGVDKVEILATLDKRTCETCADMDGIVINRSEMQPGVNAPPWHPNCRCTVAPWSEFLSKDKEAKRIARNEDDELYEIPADMKYKDWISDFVEGEPPADIKTVNKAFKAFNRFGEEITFNEKNTDRQKEIIAKLSEQYKTRLKTVGLGSEKAAGSVQMSSTVMRLSSKGVDVAIHEFAHTITNSDGTKYGLFEDKDSEFWKEIKKVQRKYLKATEGNPSLWISSYEHGSRNVDEFFAEAFTQQKMRELGFNPPKKYGTDFTYSDEVMEITDKYFGKRLGSNSIIDFVIGKSVGAKSKNYDIVDNATNIIYSIAEGTRVQNASVFAGFGGAKPLNEETVDGLVREFGGTHEKWQHAKGIAVLDVGGEDIKAEVHWFQEESVGKVKFKVKRWLYDES